MSFLPFRLRPLAALSLSTLAFTSYRQSSTCTRWIVRDPSRFAPRECPTPLILLRTPGLSWGAKTEESWRDWADMFAQRGYTTVEVDVSVDVDSSEGAAGVAGDGQRQGDGERGGASVPRVISATASELSSQIRLLAIPFPPIVIASGPACLVAQAYVSDHPASGLVMVAPPPDEDPRAERSEAEVDGKDAKAWAWPRFNYEPRFPILIMPEPGTEAAVKASRVGRAESEGLRRGGKGVVVEGMVDGPRGEGTRMEVERWMDRCGF